MKEESNGAGLWNMYRGNTHRNGFHGISDSDCSAALGDINGDGGWNVIDIVALANCVLSANCDTIANMCASDMNGDGGWNVIDVVALANCVLSANCENL